MASVSSVGSRSSQALELAGVTAHPQETVFEAATLEIRFEFLMDMDGQAFALSLQLLNQVRVVLLYKLVE